MKQSRTSGELEAPKKNCRVSPVKMQESWLVKLLVFPCLEKSYRWRTANLFLFSFSFLVVVLGPLHHSVTNPIDKSG